MAMTKVSGLGWKAIALREDVLKRSVKISLIVGPIIALLNHGDKILYGGFQALDAVKVLVTLLVPFCVSTYSSVRSELNKL